MKGPFGLGLFEDVKILTGGYNFSNFEQLLRKCKPLPLRVGRVLNLLSIYLMLRTPES